MELWDAYHEDGTLAGFDLIRGERIPSNYFHLVSEAVIQHTDGDYLLMQRSFEKENFPGIWEIGAGGSVLKGENEIEAVLREVKEETGIAGGDLKEIYHIVHKGYQSIFFGYLLTTSCYKNSIQLQDKETIDYKWISKEELIEYYDSEQYPPRLRERLKDFINSIR